LTVERGEQGQNPELMALCDSLHISKWLTFFLPVSHRHSNCMNLPSRKLWWVFTL